jgi:class 3 adenylate cyclase
VWEPGTTREERFVFHDMLEIGRLEAGRAEAPGLLLAGDSTVSFRHCVLTQYPGGRCTIRDVSRNGTRVDGRRLVPNVEVEVAAGQVIQVAAELAFVLTGANPPAEVDAAAARTVVAPGFTIATVLVGDIRDYTVMVRTAPALRLQQSVGRVFERLTAEVGRLGGTVKEYQGDAIFAFWEGSADGRQAVAACRAVLALDQLAGQLAADGRVWDVPGFRLGVDWALASGPVVIDSIGNASQRAGLSMIGEAVVRAFRLEKFATAATGPILACETTCQMAAAQFAFDSLGEMQAKGFDRPDRVYALRHARAG